MSSLPVLRRVRKHELIYLQDLSCIVCGESLLIWCEIATPLRNFSSDDSSDYRGGPILLRYQEDRDTSRVGPFGGSVKRRTRHLKARVCESCGDVELFVSDWT